MTEHVQGEADRLALLSEGTASVVHAAHPPTVSIHGAQLHPGAPTETQHPHHTLRTHTQDSTSDDVQTVYREVGMERSKTVAF